MTSYNVIRRIKKLEEACQSKKKTIICGCWDGIVDNKDERLREIRPGDQLSCLMIISPDMQEKDPEGLLRREWCAKCELKRKSMS